MEERCRTITVRLLPQEAMVLQAKAQEAHMSKAEFLKNAIHYGRAYPKRNFVAADRERLVYELNRIGNNMNQIWWQSKAHSEVDEMELLLAYETCLNLLSVCDRFVRGDEGLNI